jgi:hypothetical protein
MLPVSEKAYNDLDAFETYNKVLDSVVAYLHINGIIAKRSGPYVFTLDSKSIFYINWLLFPKDIHKIEEENVEFYSVDKEENVEFYSVDEDDKDDKDDEDLTLID